MTLRSLPTWYNVSMTQTHTTERDRAIAHHYYAREAEYAAREDRAYWRAECIALAEQIGAES